MKAPILAATTLAVSLAVGCARFHSRPLAADQVAEAFSSRTLADPQLRLYLERQRQGEFAVWPLPNWDLTDLTLAAFFYHPDLEVARAHWATARTGLVTAGERPNPTVGVTPGYNTTAPIPSPWLVTATLDIPLETAGKRAHRLAQAKHLSDAAQLNIAATAWRVRSGLRRALVDLYALSEQERLVAAQQAAQEEYVKLLEAQLAFGAIPPAEVTHARIALDTTCLAAQVAKQQRGEKRVALAEAIGVPVGALDSVEICFTGLDDVPPNLGAPTARREALLNRADVLAALSEYAASEATLRLEVAKQYPDVHLNPGYEYDQGDNKWGVGLSLELPIFSQNQGPIAEAEARRAESAARFNALQAHVLTQVERGLAAYRAVLGQSATAASLLANVERQERVLRARFEAGDVSRSEFIAGRVELATARLTRAEAVTKAQQALGQLEEALQTPVLLPADPFDLSHGPRTSPALQTP